MKTKISLDFGDSANLSSWVKEVDQALLELFYEALLSIRDYERNNTLKNSNSYNDVVKALKENPSFSESLYRRERYVQNAKNSPVDLFKVNGSPNKEKRNSLKVWCLNSARKFNEVIARNSTVFRDSVLDRVISVASETGARVNNFGALFHRKFRKREVASEQCFLRVPCKKRPYILAYNVCLIAQYQCKRVLFVEKNKGQVELLMELNQFNLKGMVVKNISQNQVKRLIEEMANEGYFSF